MLKVSKSQKQILKFSFETKIEPKYFCISPLAAKRYCKRVKKNPPISGIKCPYFLFDLFLETRAEIQKYFCSFFGANENFKKSFQN